MAIMETLIEIPAALEANVFGKLDEHLKENRTHLMLRWWQETVR